MKNQKLKPKTEADETEQICKNCKYWNRFNIGNESHSAFKKFGSCDCSKIRDLHSKRYSSIDSDELLYVGNPTTYEDMPENKPSFGERFGCIHFKMKEFIK